MLRIAAVIVVLGTPIVGVSSQLVSVVNADIATARVERDELDRYGTLLDAIAEAVAFHLDLTDERPETSDDYRRKLDRAFAAIAGAYAADDVMAATKEPLRDAQAKWRVCRANITAACLTAVAVGLHEVTSELDDDSPLENDPDNSVQFLTSLSFQATPRVLIATLRTVEAADADVRGGRSLQAAEALAVANAEQQRASEAFRQFVYAALARNASLRPLFAQPMRRINAHQVFAKQVVERALNGTALASSHSLSAVHLRTRGALEAEIAVWRQFRVAAQRLVAQRLSLQQDRRRTIVIVSFCAVLLGTLLIALIGRYMLRRDRVELESAKLEADKLRAELRQLSAERALRLQAAQFQSVFDNADLGIVIYYLDERPPHHNAALARMLGDRCANFVRERYAAIGDFAHPRPALTVDEQILREHDAVQWLSLRFSGVYDDGRCAMVVLLVRDVTEERSLQDELVHAASHDALTQLANRRAFEAALLALLRDAREPFALIYVDLDDFKPINDTLGHAAGDVVLQTMADRLRSSVASVDVCARLGGDEFAVIVRIENDRERVASIAARLVRNIAMPLHYGTQLVTVSASVGVAERRPGMMDGEALKANADRALYLAKSRGGNRHEIAEPACVENPATV